MTNLEFLKQQKQWALNMLALPASELPGTLTHEKVAQVLEETEDSLIDYTGIRLGRDGQFHACYIE